MAARSRALSRSHSTLAFVLRRTPYGEADLIVSLFTESLGQVSALARSARKSQRRFGGGLEPFHTLDAALEETRGGDLLSLREVRVVVPRPGLLGHLAGMEAAGTFLTWVRHAAPAHTPEPMLWQLTQSCLEALEAMALAAATTSERGSSLARLTLAAHGLRLLVACGWRLELEYCVESGERCPEGKAAMIDPARGGVVSRARGGGGGVRVSGEVRQRLIATQSGDTSVLEESDAELVLQLVEASLRAHAGLAG
jgi:DNA repair protein RecO (recombination protein O)